MTSTIYATIKGTRGMSSGLTLLISKKEIEAMVLRIAGEIRRDYSMKNPILIGVLKGSFVFLSDLIRALDMPMEVDFARITCYGEKDIPSTEACIINDIKTNIQNRDVIIVEDISDRGITLKALIRHLRGKNPSTVKLCSLLVRDTDGKTLDQDLIIDYFGKVIRDGFVVGYGLDYKERFRNLPDIHIIDIKSGD